MKMRKRKGLVYRGWVEIAVGGKTIKKFHTWPSAMRFANVVNRLRYTDEEWEELKRRMAWLEHMRKDSTT